jgi:hypothetical protein
VGVDLGDVGAVELAGLVRRGEVSAVEAVEAAIRAIERWDPALGAVVSPLFDRALARARLVGREPFAGVPLLLKDAGQTHTDMCSWVSARGGCGRARLGGAGVMLFSPGSRLAGPPRLAALGQCLPIAPS